MMELKPTRNKAYCPSREVFVLDFTDVLHTELPPNSSGAGCERQVLNRK